jgi:hypothetical protein
MLATVCLVALLIECLLSSCRASSEVDKSPLYQHLPNCGKTNQWKVKKETTSKALACPMIKNEEGFISEWVAYHYMHGIDHFMIYDDGSIDNGVDEVKPFMEKGIVTMRYNFTMESVGFNPDPRATPFHLAMVTKTLMERECKRWGIEHGFHYFASIDLDEYMIPTSPKLTAIDAFEKFTIGTLRPTFKLAKWNFQSTPHLLEPVDMLTIEAYQTRNKIPNKMSYYTTTANKMIYLLQPPESWLDNTERLEALGINTTNGKPVTGLDADYPNFVTDCCSFHGCGGKTPGYIAHYYGGDYRWCDKKADFKPWVIDGKGKKWAQPITLNHYARSLEKFELKSQTWHTASGETASSTGNYDLPMFFSRNIGWVLDRTALRYACQLRQVLSEITGYDQYLRPGGFWYRNPEFGREVTDPRKRGRYGRAMQNPRYDDGNVYHYHGAGQHGGMEATLPFA